MTDTSAADRSGARPAPAEGGPQKRNSWKVPLLKSSLPLEHAVSAALQDRGFTPLGPFTYLRPNEHRVPTEFSVDMRAYGAVKAGPGQLRATLELIAECKYSSRGVEWVFAPLRDTSVLSARAVTVLQHACTRQVASAPTVAFDAEFPICGRGVVLHDGAGNDAPGRANERASESLIQRGLTQLRYAAPRLAADVLEHQHKVDPETGHPAILAALLITTATLRVLRPDVDLEAVHTATEIAEVTDEAPALIVHQDPGPQLRDYADRAAGGVLLHQQHWAARLDAVREHGRHDPEVTVGRRDALGGLFASLATRTFVVNHAHLDAFLTRLQDLAETLDRTSRVFGRFGPAPDRDPGASDQLQVLPPR